MSHEDAMMTWMFRLMDYAKILIRHYLIHFSKLIHLESFVIQSWAKIIILKNTIYKKIKIKQYFLNYNIISFKNKNKYIKKIFFIILNSFIISRLD